MMKTVPKASPHAQKQTQSTPRSSPQLHKSTPQSHLILIQLYQASPPRNHLRRNYQAMPLLMDEPDPSLRLQLSSIRQNVLQPRITARLRHLQTPTKRRWNLLQL
ncbi:hypothetical protein GQ44DRAFT_717777 [Phaeosphaeriaceae sp. PMI808]|nr:hypothetical protein GQ44DRAFT_717777 [Phaeosphaeriaceae sp. PMI808]